MSNSPTAKNAMAEVRERNPYANCYGPLIDADAIYKEAMAACGTPWGMDTIFPRHEAKKTEDKKNNLLLLLCN